MQGRNGTATHTAEFQIVNKVAGGFVFSHVTCFPPSNFSKSKNKKIYIIIANGYTTKKHLEVS
jgi:hypothetical protein